MSADLGNPSPQEGGGPKHSSTPITGHADPQDVPGETMSSSVQGEAHPAELQPQQADGKDSPSPGAEVPGAPSAEGSAAPIPPASPPRAGPRVRVSLPAEADSPAPRRVSSGRMRVERELARLQQADDNQRLRHKARRQREVRKAVEAVRKEREKKGVTLTPDVEACRTAIRDMMREEERMALAKDQKKLQNETKALQKSIQDKYGVKGKKASQDLVALAESFYQGKGQDKDGIPEHVKRELTSQEIQDLRMVFDMFDVKGRGFITSDDVRRAASMLGFKAKKEVFSGMIEEVTGDKNSRVTFSHFLRFVVKGQGDGDDPLDAILQCFRMLDKDQKGYLTAADLRHAADTQKLPLSNRAIREMIQEADVSGDSKVTSDEFIHVMLQSSMFRTAH